MDIRLLKDIVDDAYQRNTEQLVNIVINNKQDNNKILTDIQDIQNDIVNNKLLIYSTTAIGMSMTTYAVCCISGEGDFTVLKGFTNRRNAELLAAQKNYQEKINPIGDNFCVETYEIEL